MALTYLIHAPAMGSVDPITGCFTSADNYELCRQTYYAQKQYELDKQNSKAQTKCDCSSYQKYIDQLNTSTASLIIENKNLKTKYQTLSEKEFDDNQCLPSTASLFFDSVFSYQGLIMLMSVVIICLGYLLYRKKINKK